jgi:hypothetical protein
MGSWEVSTKPGEVQPALQVIFPDQQSLRLMFLMPPSPDQGLFAWVAIGDWISEVSIHG